MSVLRSLFLSIIAFTLLAACVNSKPYAEWYDVSHLSEASRNLALRLRTSKSFHVPERSEVPFPKYPDARLFSGNVTGGKSDFVGVELLSRAPLAEVLRWYKRMLPDYSVFDISDGARKRYLFLNNYKSFDYHRDSFLLATNPYVVVLEISKPLEPLTVGYQTMIEMSYEPMSVLGNRSRQ